MINRIPVLALLASAFSLTGSAAETIAFFPFDEPIGLYPSSVLNDHGPGQMMLVLGRGGSIVPGKFGNAFSTVPQPEVNFPKGSVLFGLTRVPTPPGRTVEPMNWANAKFGALVTSGEKHLRKEASGPNPTQTGLNLGAFDWTVEFWYRGEAAATNATEAVIFEIGQGPRGENDHVTSLTLAADRQGFIFTNKPAETRVTIASDRAALTGSVWTHYAFVYNATSGVITHYVSGAAAPSAVAAKIIALPVGDEAYFSLGRDAHWEHPLPGALDELRFSRGAVYSAAFTPPGTLIANSHAGAPAQPAKITEPLRFATKSNSTVDLGGSKHLLIDDVLFTQHADVTFEPTPPPTVELALELTFSSRKHVVAVDDGQGLVRLYAPLENDKLGVMTSRDGLHFDLPRFATGTDKTPNIVFPEPTGTPSVFIDPLAPPGERWKMVSGWAERGIYLFVSPDGYAWKRLPTPVISARSASQSNMFYDDQRGTYIGYHRTDAGRNAFGKTERRFVMTNVASLQPPWPFQPLTEADYDRINQKLPIAVERPFYIDNGPLTPGGIGVEWPTVFRPDPAFDEPGVDIYVPKAVKYPWAPDAYFAFPCIYYHYEGSKPETRGVLSAKDHGRGSGPIETQLMASRDGVNWTRYPRPVWMDVGQQPGGFDIHQNYMAQGMIRRGDEIWMYSYNSDQYHSPHGKKDRRAIFRTVQRVDRFVAARAPYNREATLDSRPFTFTGKQLVLNVDTHASGWLQIALRNPDGTPIPGYDFDHCVYVNGNDVRYPVEWLGQGTDVSAFAGRPVQLAIKMRGADLYALQFVP